LWTPDFKNFFTPFLGFFFTFPSRYLFAIDQSRFLGLEGGPPLFEQDISLALLFLSIHIYDFPLKYGAFTLYGTAFQRSFNKEWESNGMRPFPRSLTTTNGISVDFFLKLLRCFSSLACLECYRYVPILERIPYKRWFSIEERYKSTSIRFYLYHFVAYNVLSLLCRGIPRVPFLYCVLFELRFINGVFYLKRTLEL
jgi:hypothetical protein